MQQLNQLYRNLSKRWPSDHRTKKTMRKKKKNSVMSAEEDFSTWEDEDATTCSRSSMRFVHEPSICNTTTEQLQQQETEKDEEKRRKPSPGSVKFGGYVLAKKLKELELMDADDVDHVMDVKEVLHYYSRLTCPVYLDIIDKFFVDIYLDFFLPPPLVSGLHSSMRRLGPVKC